MKILAITTVATVLFTGSFKLNAQNISLKAGNLTPYGVLIKSETYKGKEAIVLEQLQVSDSQKSFALLKDLDFHNGTLEITLSGQVGIKASETARGFVGLAFRYSRILLNLSYFIFVQLTEELKTRYAGTILYSMFLIQVSHGKSCERKHLRNMNPMPIWFPVNGQR